MFDTKTVVALVGNPNCGKTTLFNSQAVIMMSATE